MPNANKVHIRVPQKSTKVAIFSPMQERKRDRKKKGKIKKKKKVWWSPQPRLLQPYLASFLQGRGFGEDPRLALALAPDLSKNLTSLCRVDRYQAVGPFELLMSFLWSPHTHHCRRGYVSNCAFVSSPWPSIDDSPSIHSVQVAYLPTTHACDSPETHVPSVSLQWFRSAHSTSSHRSTGRSVSRIHLIDILVVFLEIIVRRTTCGIS